MTRLRRYLNWLLIWMLTAAAIKTPAFANSVDSTPTLVFRVLNLAQVPGDVLLVAKGHVEHSYGKAGIKTLWLEGDTALPTLAGRNILQLTILLIPESAAGKLGDFDEGVTGFAVSNDNIGARRAYVFAERANKKAFFRRSGRTGFDHTDSHLAHLKGKTLDGLILGYVIAHEAGHLMLPKGHSSTGLMRARIDVKSIYQALVGSLLFTSDQTALIRATLLTQSGR